MNSLNLIICSTLKHVRETLPTFQDVSAKAQTCDELKYKGKKRLLCYVYQDVTRTEGLRGEGICLNFSGMNWESFLDKEFQEAGL